MNLHDFQALELEPPVEITVRTTDKRWQPVGALRSADAAGLVIVPRSGLPITIGWPIVASVSL